jgi:hypothetical protein
VSRGFIGTGGQIGCRRLLKTGGVLVLGGVMMADGVRSATGIAVVSRPLVFPGIPGGRRPRIFSVPGLGGPGEPVVPVIARSVVMLVAPTDRKPFKIAAVAGPGRPVARLVSLPPGLAGRSCLPRRSAFLVGPGLRRGPGLRWGPGLRRGSSLSRRPGLPRRVGRRWRPGARRPGRCPRARGRLMLSRGGDPGLAWRPGTGPGLARLAWQPGTGSGFAGLAGSRPGIAGLGGTGIGPRVRTLIALRQYGSVLVRLGLGVGRGGTGVAGALPPGGPVGVLVLLRRHFGWRTGFSRVLRPRFTT